MKKEVSAAITAAVDAYLRIEEAQRTMPSVVIALPVNPWKLFGRQEQMRVRASIQQKSWHR